ncbi:hypothetical protein M378DRAFT_11090, partial [Amanita muscaria Koide BX008]
DGRVELWETSPTKRPIVFHQAHEKPVRALGFGPDGGLFASGSGDGITKLWNGEDGSLRGTLQAPRALRAVALSNSMLVARSDDGDATLWSLDTLSIIHTFGGLSGRTSTIAIAENSVLITVISVNTNDDSANTEIRIAAGICFDQCVVYLLDVVNHTIIATFNVPYEIHTTTFLPDNSQLVAQSIDGASLSLNLINKHITKGPTLEHLIQLPNTPLWRGVPVWHCQDKEQHYFSALFPQHKSPVPVLRIPRDLRVSRWSQGVSMIALGCRDGRVILLRLPAMSADGYSVTV